MPLLHERHPICALASQARAIPDAGPWPNLHVANDVGIGRNEHVAGLHGHHEGLDVAQPRAGWHSCDLALGWGSSRVMPGRCERQVGLHCRGEQERGWLAKEQQSLCSPSTPPELTREGIR